jgi:hypothetical protein
MFVDDDAFFVGDFRISLGVVHAQVANERTKDSQMIRASQKRKKATAAAKAHALNPTK